MAVNAVGIKELYYGAVMATAPTKATLSTIKSGLTKVGNVHQDTWSLEEAEPSQDSYKNQLTGTAYRMGTKQMGDIKISFTIGSYDYATKAALLGGSTITASDVVVGWQRARGIVSMEKSFLAVTDDDQVVVFPRCNVLAHEANADGAIGIGMSATVLEPDGSVDTPLAPEYWFNDAAAQV